MEGQTALYTTPKHLKPVNTPEGTSQRKKIARAKPLSVRERWELSIALGDDGLLRLDQSIDLPFHFIEIDDCVRRVIKDDEPVVVQYFPHGRTLSDNRLTPLGKRLLHCFQTDFRQFEQQYPGHVMSPFVSLFAGVAKKLGVDRRHFDIEAPQRMMGFVAELKDAAKVMNLGQMIADLQKAVSDNAESLTEYMKNLFECYSRLLVIRIDLRFRNDLATKFGQPIANQDFVQKCYTRYMKHLSRKFPALVGFARKLEYGPVRGYHFHMLFFFNGRLVREDITLGRLLGEHWIKVTKGNGTYWNCNAHKGPYINNNTLGIGMIHRGDKQMRDNMELAALYLVKIDYYIRLCWPPRWKTFTKGNLLAKVSGTAGRPRKLASLLDEEALRSANPTRALRHFLRGGKRSRPVR